MSPATNTSAPASNATDENPYAAYATTIHATSCWIATFYLGIVIILITLSRTYRNYPGSALRWILYIEWASSLVYGPIKWWPKSTFHIPLALAPGPAACYFTIFTDTFFIVGVVYSSTICAYAFYTLTANASFDVSENERRRKNFWAAAGFWFFAGGLSGLNISGGYHINGWCQSSSKSIVGTKLAIVCCMFVAQVYFVLHGIVRLSRLQQHFTRMSTEGDGAVARGCFALSRSQRVLCAKFLTILVTQLISWIPQAYAEFSFTFIGPTSLEFLFFLSSGHSIGAVIDATAILLNDEVKKRLARKSNTKVMHRSNDFSSKVKKSAAPSMDKYQVNADEEAV